MIFYAYAVNINVVDITGNDVVSVDSIYRLLVMLLLHNNLWLFHLYTFEVVVGFDSGDIRGILSQ